ncbi:DUF4148 domain-containing protein [Paraburkholderia sp.]|jgi:hypothetical protein|uniref:DUF4148 domain-containing protein n=1 Tax=Paraburkholderia sp. TaxID=1926495 RepID=UPI002F41D48A
MKFMSRVMLGAALGAWCVTSGFAQASPGSCDPSAPKTRAEVKADLAQWLAAGYDPLDWLDYPDNAQRAGRIVSQQRAAADNHGACPQ